MELGQLEQFITIVECRTMRAAAEQLGLSQPTLSQSIKKLERELKCPLFERAHNKMVLLEYGDILYERAKRALAELAAASGEIAEAKDRRSTTLVIGCYSNAFAANVFPQLAFEHPELTIDVTCCASELLVQDFRSGHYDAIVFTSLGQAPSMGEELFTEQLVLSVPCTSELANWTEIDVSRLSAYDLFIVDDFPGYSSWYRSVLDCACCKPPRVEFAHSNEYLARMDRQDKPHFSSDFLQSFLGKNDRRVNVRVASDISSRTLFYAFREDRSDMLEPAFDAIAKTLRENDPGSAYIPFRMYPGFINNLHISTV